MICHQTIEHIVVHYIYNMYDYNIGSYLNWHSNPTIKYFRNTKEFSPSLLNVFSFSWHSKLLIYFIYLINFNEINAKKHWLSKWWVLWWWVGCQWGLPPICCQYWLTLCSFLCITTVMVFAISLKIILFIINWFDFRSLFQIINYFPLIYR